MISTGIHSPSPLSSFAGHTITLRLTSSALGSGLQNWGVYQHPRLDVALDPRAAVPPEAGTRAYVPRLSPRVVLLRTTDTPHMQPMNACVGDVTHVFVRAIASPTDQPVVLAVAYQAEIGGVPVPSSPIDIPLYADGIRHTYTYALKLLQFPPDLRLMRISVYPVIGPPWARMSTPGLVKVQDARLIYGGGNCSA